MRPICAILLISLRSPEGVQEEPFSALSGTLELQGGDRGFQA